MSSSSLLSSETEISRGKVGGALVRDVKEVMALFKNVKGDDGCWNPHQTRVQRVT